jgi:hypothetical protein
MNEYVSFVILYSVIAVKAYNAPGLTVQLARNELDTIQKRTNCQRQRSKKGCSAKEGNRNHMFSMFAYNTYHQRLRDLHEYSLTKKPFEGDQSDQAKSFNMNEQACALQFTNLRASIILRLHKNGLGIKENKTADMKLVRNQSSLLRERLETEKTFPGGRICISMAK